MHVVRRRTSARSPTLMSVMLCGPELLDPVEIAEAVVRVEVAVERDEVLVVGRRRGRRRRS